MDCLGKVIFFDEFLWDVQELYAHIFGSPNQGLEVKVFQIKSDKVCIATRQNAVNDKFDENTCSGRRTYIPGVANLTTYDGDACSIGIFFVRFHLADNHGVANLSSCALGDFLKLDEAKGIFAFHMLVLGAF